jgi:hypothetical protein
MKRASSIDNDQERDPRTETDLDLVSAFDDVQGADSNVIAHLYFGRMKNCQNRDVDVPPNLVSKHSKEKHSQERWQEGGEMKESGVYLAPHFPPSC